MKLSDSDAKRKLCPYQSAIGVRNGAEKMGRSTAYYATQLTRHVWPDLDVQNAYMHLDCIQTVVDLRNHQPLARVRGLALHTVPAIYAHGQGAPTYKYFTVDGVVQGCGIDLHMLFYLRMHQWIGLSRLSRSQGRDKLRFRISKRGPLLR